MITSGDARIASILALPDRLRVVEPGICSVLDPGAPVQPYDRRASAYDAIVGSGLYNRWMWGVDRRHYHAFAARAVGAAPSGWHLDAGCGSLVFMHEIYRRTPDRPRVLMDKSLGMLRAARARLSVSIPPDLDPPILLQSDLCDLPFRPQVFTTVLCMGMLHLLSDAASVVRNLARLVAPGGSIWLTSLVRDRVWGDRYLRVLHRAGEVATPRSAVEVEDLLGVNVGWPIEACREGNMLFVRLTAA